MRPKAQSDVQQGSDEQLLQTAPPSFFKKHQFCKPGFPQRIQFNEKNLEVTKQTEKPCSKSKVGKKKLCEEPEGKILGFVG